MDWPASPASLPVMVTFILVLTQNHIHSAILKSTIKSGLKILVSAGNVLTAQINP